jgi:hypothetical protein
VSVVCAVFDDPALVSYAGLEPVMRLAEVCALPGIVRHAGVVRARVQPRPRPSTQAVSREFLVQLARRTPLLPGAGAVTFIDVDSLLRRMYGKKKQGVGFGADVERALRAATLPPWNGTLPLPECHDIAAQNRRLCG